MHEKIVGHNELNPKTINALNDLLKRAMPEFIGGDDDPIREDIVNNDRFRSTAIATMENPSGSITAMGALSEYAWSPYFPDGNARVLTVHLVAIDPDNRRQGLGRKIIGNLINDGVNSFINKPQDQRPIIASMDTEHPFLARTFLEEARKRNDIAFKTKRTEQQCPKNYVLFPRHSENGITLLSFVTNTNAPPDISKNLGGNAISTRHTHLNAYQILDQDSYYFNLTRDIFKQIGLEPDKNGQYTDIEKEIFLRVHNQIIAELQKRGQVVIAKPDDNIPDIFKSGNAVKLPINDELRVAIEITP